MSGSPFNSRQLSTYRTPDSSYGQSTIGCILLSLSVLPVLQWWHIRQFSGANCRYLPATVQSIILFGTYFSGSRQIKHVPFRADNWRQRAKWKTKLK